jgi:dihydrofolate reductase
MLMILPPRIYIDFNPAIPMRKIVLFIASSFDLFIARRDGSVDWLFTDADYGYSKFYKSVDTVLVGRKTFDLALSLGERFAGKRCIVFSRNGRKNGNAEFVSDPVAFTKSLLKTPGKDIWLVGGGEIVSIFLNAGLIHEIILSIHPIVLGSGIPLFKGLRREIRLRLVKSEKFKSGLVQLHYKALP